MAHILHIDLVGGEKIVFGPFPTTTAAQTWANENKVSNQWSGWTCHEVHAPVEYQLNREGDYDPAPLHHTDLTFVTNEEMLDELAGRFEACAFVGNKEVDAHQTKGVFFAAGPDPYVLGLLNTAGKGLQTRMLGVMLGGMDDNEFDPQDL